ncbi:acyl-CoA N-acyltransferase [Auriculariales sp. MPI-PUGE-AT-0066]|nr:acyl-CoA N-acyltransferase [Auriculariales sp. MPI-PUGE-AT-0066]
MSAHIRLAGPNDLDALSRICLLTAAAGKDATAAHTIGTLPGYVYAVPYGEPAVKNAGGQSFAFILESDEPTSAGDPVGYVVGTAATRDFERALDAAWWPDLRARHPPPTPETEAQFTDADKTYLKMLHAPPRAQEAVVQFAPAHIHINILPSHQRQGWGRKLIVHAARHLKSAHGLDKLWLGIDSKNDSARTFYLRIGFEPLDAPDGEYLGLRFEKVL